MPTRGPRTVLQWSINAVLSTAIFLMSLLAMPRPASAQSIQVLYSFGVDSGYTPYAGLIRDPQGNLYGTTEQGGSGSCNCGTIFKLTSSNQETTLHTFTGPPDDGANPFYGALIADSSGNGYGTTEQGGTSNLGTVFQLTSTGQELVLHSFAGGKKDGAYPYGGLVRDKSGNLYGTTFAGGASDVGTIFRLSPSGAMTVLHSFAAGNDGASPSAGLVIDSHGNAYGTTEAGGESGFGTVYRIDSKGGYSLLYSFMGGNDGAKPIAGLILDPAGNLYGTTSGGGSSSSTVFEVTPAGEETVLYDDLNQAAGGLVRDSAGNLYGTDWDTVFRIDTHGDLSILVELDSTTGYASFGSLILDPVGSLYGTASEGGLLGDSGTVFKVVP
jgi:uncharacterized repeat protein (TIGR03803 family)